MPLTEEQRERLREKRKRQRRRRRSRKRAANQAVGRLGGIRGRKSEDRAQTLMAVLITDDDRFELVRHATEEEEQEGADLMVASDRGDLPIQVKSSFNDIHTHKLRYPDIPVVVVKGNDETVTERLSEALEAVYYARRQAD